MREFFGRHRQAKSDRNCVCVSGSPKPGATLHSKTVTTVRLHREIVGRGRQGGRCRLFTDRCDEMGIWSLSVESLAGTRHLGVRAANGASITTL